MSHQALIKAFQNILGADNVFTETADRLTYSYDAAISNRPDAGSSPPDARPAWHRFRTCCQMPAWMCPSDTPSNFMRKS